MLDIQKDLRLFGFEGDIDQSPATRDQFSHDASMFELLPSAVLHPKSAKDLETLVSWVNQAKTKYNGHLSLTARSAGTDMGGGAITESIIVDMTKYFNKIGDVSLERAVVQPGVYYRDFEKQTLKHGALMPSYPASRELCTVGGMVANTSGGENSLQHGKTDKVVTQLSV